MGPALFRNGMAMHSGDEPGKAKEWLCLEQR